MTILDKQTMFSDDQAMGDSAASTNYLNLGTFGTPVNGNAINRDIGPGNPIPITVQVTTDFSDLTSLKVAVQMDTEPTFSSAETVLETEAILQATLVAGYKFNLDFIPQKTSQQYVRLYYTIVGTTETTGTITAGVSGGHQTNNG